MRKSIFHILFVLFALFHIWGAPCFQSRSGDLFFSLLVVTTGRHPELGRVWVSAPAISCCFLRFHSVRSAPVACQLASYSQIAVHPRSWSGWASPFSARVSLPPPVIFNTGFRIRSLRRFFFGTGHLTDLLPPLVFALFWPHLFSARSFVWYENSSLWFGLLQGRKQCHSWATGSKSSRFYSLNCSLTVTSRTRPSGIRWNACEDISCSSARFLSSISHVVLLALFCVSAAVSNPVLKADSFAIAVWS
jgi:hypothetical protein